MKTPASTRAQRKRYGYQPLESLAKATGGVPTKKKLGLIKADSSELHHRQTVGFECRTVERGSPSPPTQRTAVAVLPSVLLAIVLAETVHEFRTRRSGKHGGKRFVGDAPQYGFELFE